MDSIVSTILGAIVGAIAKEFTPDLRPLFTGKARANSDLIAEWKCTWFPLETGEMPINDVVTIY